MLSDVNWLLMKQMKVVDELMVVIDKVVDFIDIGMNFFVLMFRNKFN